VAERDAIHRDLSTTLRQKPKTFSRNNKDNRRRKGKRKKIWRKRNKRRGAGFRDLAFPIEAAAREGDVTPYSNIYNIFCDISLLR